MTTVRNAWGKHRKNLCLHHALGLNHQQTWDALVWITMLLRHCPIDFHFVIANLLKHKFGLFAEMTELPILLLIFQVSFAMIPNLVIISNQGLRCVKQVVQLSTLVTFRDKRYQIMFHFFPYI